MVPRSASLWNCATLRLRLGLRTHADVHHRYFQYSRCDSLRAHAGQRRVLAALILRANPSDLSLVESRDRLPRRFSYPCKLELGTAQVLKHEPVARKFRQVNCRRERRLNFDSVLITELISAADFSDEDGAVTRKFPNRLIFSARHP